MKKVPSVGSWLPWLAWDNLLVLEFSLPANLPPPGISLPFIHLQHWSKTTHLSILSETQHTVRSLPTHKHTPPPRHNRIIWNGVILSTRNWQKWALCLAPPMPPLQIQLTTQNCTHALWTRQGTQLKISNDGLPRLGTNHTFKVTLFFLRPRFYLLTLWSKNCYSISNRHCELFEMRNLKHQITINTGNQRIP